MVGLLLQLRKAAAAGNKAKKVKMRTLLMVKKEEAKKEAPRFLGVTTLCRSDSMCIRKQLIFLILLDNVAITISTFHYFSERQSFLTFESHLTLNFPAFYTILTTFNPNMC